MREAHDDYDEETRPGWVVICFRNMKRRDRDRDRDRDREGGRLVEEDVWVGGAARKPSWER